MECPTNVQPKWFTKSAGLESILSMIMQAYFNAFSKTLTLALAIQHA